jgi:hypothetical protein
VFGHVGVFLGIWDVALCRHLQGTTIMDGPSSGIGRQIATAANSLFAYPSDSLRLEIRRITEAQAHEATSDIDPVIPSGAHLVQIEPPSQETRAPRKGRTNRQVAGNLIAEHLNKRPHDTAVEVAHAVGCSTGLVGESSAWKLNQQRLKTAKKQGIDPIGVKLNEYAVNGAGASPSTQLHRHQEQTTAADAKFDDEEKVLFKRIGDFQNQHPDGTLQETAACLNCTSGDVERRQAMVNRLTAQQADSQKEDSDEVDDTAKNGKRQKWIEKRP